MEPNNRLIDSDRFIKIIGEGLKKTDAILFSVLAKRMGLSKLVELWKHRHGDQPILRKEVETQRLEHGRDLAKAMGLDPNFVHAILYLVISESCRLQIEHHQARTPDKEESKDAWQGFLRENLLKLTEVIAPEYDSYYDKNAPFATRSLLDFEGRILNSQANELKGLGNNKRALDLGCATGRIAFELSPLFEEVVGWDVSTHMITTAEMKKNRNVNFFNFKNVHFEAKDMEKGIADLEPESVSLAVANIGTASDIYDFQIFLKHLKRAMAKDGRFLFSFYNSGALIYWVSVPWITSLSAEIDPVAHCLDVRVRGADFQIHARPYTVRELKKLFSKENGLSVSHIRTYPTVTALLPNGFFQDEESRKQISFLDDKLSEIDKGAYIIVAGRKNP